MGEKMKRLIDIPARKLLLLINNLSGAGFSSALAEKVSLDSNAAQAVELLEKAFLEPKVSSLEVVRVVPIEPMYVSTGSFNNMVTLGEYDYVDDEITEDRWIIERSGKGRVQKEPVLLRFFGRGKTEEVLAYMEENDLCPGKVEDLLKLGEWRPELQRLVTVVQIGSVALYGGYPMGLCLGGYGGPEDEEEEGVLPKPGMRRTLKLRSVGGMWESDDFVLAIKKK